MPLVYWQEIVVAVRNYARTKYGKDILVTSNGLFPFVDFQSVGLYDYNPDGPGPIGVDYAPLTGSDYDGTLSFMPTFASLKARSDAIMTGDRSTAGSAPPLSRLADHRPSTATTKCRSASGRITCG